MIIKDKRIEQALSLPVFSTIQKAADALNLDVFVIGGYVRDTFLKSEARDRYRYCRRWQRHHTSKKSSRNVSGKQPDSSV